MADHRSSTSSPDTEHTPSPVVAELRRLRARVAELELALGQALADGRCDIEAQSDQLAPQWMTPAPARPGNFADAWSLHEDGDAQVDASFLRVGCIDEQARSWLLTGT